MSSIPNDIINEQFDWPDIAEIGEDWTNNMQDDAEMIANLNAVIAEQKQLIAQQKYMIDRYQPVIEDNARLRRQIAQLERRLFIVVGKLTRQLPEESRKEEE